jgi:tRNA (guanine-N7-)-methyltransferase
MNQLDPKAFVITRKRKKYKFALFHNNPLCFEIDQWPSEPHPDVLEIGAGTGLFAVELAGRAKETQVVAIDVKADRLQTGARLANEEGLSNLRFLRARVDQLAELIPTHSIDKIWVTFPDPFPKSRYAKHRLTHPRFLELYKTLLKPSGVLYFKTDARELFEWSLEQLVKEGWMLEELSFDLHQASLDDSYKVQTTYEARYTAQGKKIGFVKAMPPSLAF